MVLLLTRKLDEFPTPLILSILSVPKLKGRIYVEALAPEPVVDLCNGMVFVYISSMFSVPIVERVALLAPTDPPSICRGDLVRIRNGRYAADVGEVVEATEPPEGPQHLVVRLKSRQPLPQEKKRKRGNNVRHEPYVLDQVRLRMMLRLDTKADLPATSAYGFEYLGDNGFILNKKRYTTDGFLLLSIQSDRVDRAKIHGDKVDLLVAKDSEHIKERHTGNLSNMFLSARPVRVTDWDSVDFALETFIHLGDTVRITEGQSAGAVGRVVEVKPRAAVVDIGTEDLVTRRPVLLETKLVTLTRIFEIGEHVEIKVGEFKGRSGIVALKDGPNIFMVNPREMAEVSKPYLSRRYPMTLAFP